MNAAERNARTLFASFATKKNPDDLASSKAHKLNEEIFAKFGPPDETGHVEVPLSALKPGDIAHVLAIKGDISVRQHLQELGFTSGTEIEFVRVAPLSDPITVQIRGYQLALRVREADVIWVRRCPAAPHGFQLP